jgi:hypothetical protein
VRTEKGGERTRERKERGRGKELKEEGWAARRGKWRMGWEVPKCPLPKCFNLFYLLFYWLRGDS